MVNIEYVSGEYTTPNDGKFFYTQLFFKEGKSFITMGVGSDNEKVNLLLNSEELTMAVFSTNCSDAVAISGI